MRVFVRSKRNLLSSVRMYEKSCTERAVLKPTVMLLLRSVMRRNVPRRWIEPKTDAPGGCSKSE